jgi:hemerythrin
VSLSNHIKRHTVLAGAIRTSSPRERQLEIDKAIEVYEDALNRALYELLDKHFANEDSSLA